MSDWKQDLRKNLNIPTKHFLAIKKTLSQLRSLKPQLPQIEMKKFPIVQDKTVIPNNPKRRKLSEDYIFSTRQETTILPADEPKRKKVGFEVYTEMHIISDQVNEWLSTEDKLAKGIDKTCDRDINDRLLKVGENVLIVNQKDRSEDGLYKVIGNHLFFVSLKKTPSNIDPEIYDE